MRAEPAGRTPRIRRSGDEVRSRLIAAGRDVFAERGYAGASTKEIARRAEVGEVLLFRHFGNKAGLFDEAVLDPFAKFVDEWVHYWARRGLHGESIEELATDYVELLYGFFEDNRQLVTALLSARAHHEATADRLEELFSRLEATAREGSAEYGLPVRDPVLTVRLTFGMVLSAVVHAELLFAAGDSLSRERIVHEVACFLLHGIAHLPEPPAQPRRVRGRRRRNQ
ncbi:TetR/AcrR family transcriptional regulator [uncultured Mycobacterium sp.]|uniref:TetR/AcrR family transcriptional regulator n=1 Tax=uncultured Mycobacterium sp. TaxID=171292 RepID=UPI0035C9C9A6